MQLKHSIQFRDSLRNKLMVVCALVAAAVLATPAAMAHEHRGHGDNTAAVVGALVVGAVIGGVLASSSHHDNYYRGGYYYPAQRYPSNYYSGYPAYSYNSYPGYSYSGGYYAPAPRYGSRVNIGVVYSSHGNRSYRDRSYRHDYRGYRGHDGDRWQDRRGDRRGHYYRGH